MASLAVVTSVVAIFCVLNVQFAESKYYVIFRNKVNWFTANQECRKHGYWLATVFTDMEHQNLKKVIQKEAPGNENNFWISLSCLKNKGQFNWFSVGRPVVNFTPWSQGQPDNQNNAEDCVSMHPSEDYRWKDSSCRNENFFVCDAEK